MTASRISSLQGRFTVHHRFLLKEQLAHIDSLEERIAGLNKEIAVRLRPFESQLKRLETIPGIKRRLAEAILAEIGENMSRFRKSRGTSRRGLAWCAVSRA